uniref:Ribosome-inactivating protein n=1 Tax=Iris hollandica TaxID=35876 RepID=Q8W2E7_IRIHO|nr:ribosome-inactivating protein IRAb [Iris x hollandica]
MHKKVNIKACLVSAIIWIWWAAIVGPAILVCSSSLSVTRGGHKNLPYKKVEFHITGCTKDTYSAFIQSLRTHLSSGTSEYGIPLMRAQNPSSSQELLLVEIFGWDNEPVTLVLNLVNAYVIAYQAQGHYYLLHDTPDNPQLYGSDAHRLSFDGSYPALQHVAGEYRENIDLGINELGSAILVLHQWSPPTVERTVARSFIVLIQMVSEAARFRAIETRVRRNIIQVGDYRSFRPGAGMLDLETNWGTLSERVQESNEGVFANRLTLQTTNFETIHIYNAQTARQVCGLALLLFACKARQSLQALLPPHDSPVLPTLLDLNVVRSMLDIVEDDTCPVSEPTMRISGRDGYCMDVKDGLYHNGNPVTLSSCKQNNDVNQFWTFKSDGTIQSNGKCLTAYGYNAGAYVMIYDCSSAVMGATLWTMYNGSLINRPSGLAISAESGESGTTLTMQVHLNASKQGWLPSNNTRPFLTPIIGINGLCVQRNDQEDVGLATCDDNNSNQKWYLYGDGSIRPLTDPNYCVTSQTHDQGSQIILLSCNFGGASQRWMFTSQGTIYNLHSGYVMDVKQSDPSLQQIIIWSTTGNPNQMWFTTF